MLRALSEIGVLFAPGSRILGTYPEDRMRFHVKRKKVICGVHLTFSIQREGCASTVLKSISNRSLR